MLIIQLGKNMETLGSWGRKNWMGGRGKTEAKWQYISRNFQDAVLWEVVSSDIRVFKQRLGASYLSEIL